MNPAAAELAGTNKTADGQTSAVSQHDWTPMLDTIISRSGPLVDAPAAQNIDLLAEATAAYDAQQDAALRYRELAIGREFRQRFGVTPEPPAYSQRTSLSKSGYWSFRAAGLTWQGCDEGDGNTRRITFAVLAVNDSWEEASTKEQLGQLVRRGIQFEQAS